MVGFLYSRTRLLSAGLLFVSLTIAAGCGGGPGDKLGAVEGTVTIDGKNANSGSVVFAVGDSKVQGAIDPEGKYRAVGVPVGEANVTVISAPKTETPKVPISPTATKDMPASAPTVSKPVPIPDKYKTAGALPKFTVKSGTNKHDIALTK